MKRKDALRRVISIDSQAKRKYFEFPDPRVTAYLEGNVMCVFSPSNPMIYAARAVRKHMQDEGFPLVTPEYRVMVRVKNFVRVEVVFPARSAPDSRPALMCGEAKKPATALWTGQCNEQPTDCP